jgi:hypothetical protein
MNIPQNPHLVNAPCFEKGTLAFFAPEIPADLPGGAARKARVRIFAAQYQLIGNGALL